MTEHAPYTTLVLMLLQTVVITNMTPITRRIEAMESEPVLGVGSGERWAVWSSTRTLSFFVFVVMLSVFAAACGQSSPEQGGGQANGGEETTGGGAGETTGGTAGSEFQGVVDSYAVGQGEIDAEGGEQQVGPYRVGYIVEPAEGWWEGEPPDLEWREPASGETNHIEILPFDAETGLLIPSMDIELTVLDESGEEVESKPLEFYYAEFYHYANNFSLPESGTYTLRAELSPPDFRRHGDEEGEGRVYENRAVATFEDVQIETEGE